ncbi:MAG: alpha/beta hydrolase fold domain-containing protein [Gammaproteobacteria bacterium]|nr:alpha/beta hydrolase fold domain-containing protein [Gammaproteobacteria bacterium]
MELNYARLDPELAAALATLPPNFGRIDRGNLQQVREVMAAQRAVPVTSDSVGVERRHIPGPDGDVPVILYRRPAESPQAALLWIHGGGYILGTAEDDRGRVIAESLDCAVVSVDYRLAPEHPFPAGPEDCHAALLWLAANAAALNIDSDRIAIGGASAGGGMAAGVALMNRDRHGPDLRMQLLLYPMIDNLHATPSGRYVNHPVWNRQTSFNAWEMYLAGTPGLDASPYAAASRAEDLSGLPPAYVCVGSEDLFRDEDIDYARRLLDADVPCELSVFPGLYHGGDVFVPHARISRHLTSSVLSALAFGLDLQQPSFAG